VMTSDRIDDSDYPYAAPRDGERSAQQLAIAGWRWKWRWFKRLALSVAAIAVFTLTFCGFVAYKAVIRAWSVSELEQRGCRVEYAHQRSGGRDVLPEFLRDRVGDHVWSEVAAVTRYDFTPRRDELSADDVRSICTACRKFRKLQLFIISSHHFSCEQMRDWPSLRRLEELDINSAKLGDPDLAITGRMAQLKFLKLGHAK